MIGDKLLIGTYNGIRFPFREAGRTGGRKTVFHTYPNSNITLAEDLGRAPRTFTLVIIVQGDGYNYYSNRDAIISALESEGPNILEHPTEGQLKVQPEGKYNITERLDSLGYSEIRQTFRQVDNKNFLDADLNTLSFLSNQRDIITEALENTFMSNLFTKTQTAFETTQAYTTSLLNNADDVSSVIFDSLDNYNAYKSNIVSFATFYPDRISNLGANITSIFDEISNTVTSPTDQLSFYSSFFDFLDNAETFNPTTRDLYFTQNNQEAYKSYIQGMALSYATAAASDINYTSDEQQNSTISAIVEQFEKVLRLPFIASEQDTIQIDTSREFTGEFEATDPIVIYNDLIEQKVGFLDFMKDKEVTTPKVIEVDVVNENLNNLVYRYYGSLDNYDTIKDLNDLEQTSYLNGTYKVLSA